MQGALDGGLIVDNTFKGSTTDHESACMQVVLGITAGVQMQITLLNGGTGMVMTGSVRFCPLSRVAVIFFEGDAFAVQRVVAAVALDERHCSLTLIEKTVIRERRCGGFDLKMLDEGAWREYCTTVSQRTQQPNQLLQQQHREHHQKQQEQRQQQQQQEQHQQRLGSADVGWGPFRNPPRAPAHSSPELVGMSRSGGSWDILQGRGGWTQGPLRAPREQGSGGAAGGLDGQGGGQRRRRRRRQQQQPAATTTTQAAGNDTFMVDRDRVVLDSFLMDPEGFVLDEPGPGHVAGDMDEDGDGDGDVHSDDDSDVHSGGDGDIGGGDALFRQDTLGGFDDYSDGKGGAVGVVGAVGGDGGGGGGTGDGGMVGGDQLFRQDTLGGFDTADSFGPLYAPPVAQRTGSFDPSLSASGQRDASFLLSVFGLVNVEGEGGRNGGEAVNAAFNGGGTGSFGEEGDGAAGGDSSVPQMSAIPFGMEQDEHDKSKSGALGGL